VWVWFGFLILATAAACTADGRDEPGATEAARSGQGASASGDLADIFRRECVINVSPRHYDPGIGVFPSVSELRADLRLLKKYGFTGVATYGAAGTLREIPRRAKKSGFTFVAMGVWDPASEEEVNAAIDQREWVDLFLVGNEGITTGRYSLSELKHAVTRIRAGTSRPVSTVETLAAYESHPDLWRMGDAVFANHHPWWAGLRDPEEAAVWMDQEYEMMSSSYSGKPAGRRLEAPPRRRRLSATFSWPLGGGRGLRTATSRRSILCSSVVTQ
jgi:exo-beta-1,3-glucanase (GH17 family)